MSRVKYKDFSQISYTDLEVYSCLPDHPIWSRAAEEIDFSFADEICAHLYTGRGQHPYAPSLKLKLHLIKGYYNASDREVEEKVIGDLFIKRFLGLPVTFTGFDHSTLGLDRDRIGAELFHACHHHILAQAKRKGVWGDKKDLWLVDSFPTDGAVATRSTYRLIQQAMLRIINHLKRSNPVLFGALVRDQPAVLQTSRFPHEGSTAEKTVAFSEVVVQALGLLYWFEKESVRPAFWSWKNKNQQLTSLERQACLYQILNQRVYPEDPSDPDAPYKKRVKGDRPKGLIISAVDPSVRRGYKSKTVRIKGDKIQVVMSAHSRLVLEAEPIAGNEDDGYRLLELVEKIHAKHDIYPEAIVGDTAYGTGSNHQACTDLSLPLSAPIWSQVGANHKGCYGHEKFTYHAEEKAVTCPKGHTTKRQGRMKSSNGTQYIFSASTCKECPVRSECTSAENAGRKVFISDYYELHQQAKILNASERGQQYQAARYAIEPKNNEMKNHQGLGKSKSRSRRKRRRDVMIASMVVNIKVMIQQAGGSTTLGFYRKKTNSPRGKSAQNTG